MNKKLENQVDYDVCLSSAVHQNPLGQRHFYAWLSFPGGVLGENKS